MKKNSSSFAYIWEFDVKKNCRGRFEKVYGSGGKWIRLFEQSSGYIGTELHKDITTAGRYLTIDHWISEAAYKQFRKRYKHEFEELDNLCESLTKEETFLGSFACLATLPRRK